jgi:hypothetical protein
MNKQDIIRVFGLYIGCEVHFTNAKLFGSDWEVLLTGVDISTFQVRIGAYFPNLKDCNQSQSLWLPVEYVQLRLKSLEEITDDDAIEVARIVLGQNEYWKPVEVLRWYWCTKVIVCREPDITDNKVTVEMSLSIVSDKELTDRVIMWQDSYNNERGSAIEDKGVPNILSATDFLRSRGYALPYMGCNLFEAGIAIKKPNN